MKINPSHICFSIFVIMPCSQWLNVKASESVKKKKRVFCRNILNALHDFLSDAVSVLRKVNSL